MISNIKDTLVVSLLMIASLSSVENAIAGPYSGAVYQGEEFLGTYAAGIDDCHAVLQHHQNQLQLLGWQVNEAESCSWGLILVAEQNDNRRIVIQCNWG
jgi:hypothetical protein